MAPDWRVTQVSRSLKWWLVREPQWTTEDGYIGHRISVQTEDARHRELILEYPFPENSPELRPTMLIAARA
jgi:hypothetical protein